MFEPPFRWDIRSQNYLGSLLEGERSPAYDGFCDQLLPCCSRVLAFAGDSDLVFVGRSPESIFDHLSGLLFDTSWHQRLVLLQFSMRFNSEAEVRRTFPTAIPAIRSYLEHLNLHPRGLVSRTRPVAFIDLVATGSTFGRLVNLLHTWSLETGTDWCDVRRKIRLVGITEKTKTSPNTWRWQQHVEWRDMLGRGVVKNVSIPAELWDYLGNRQFKVTRTYGTAHWGDESNARPYYGKQQLMALCSAFDLFEAGKTTARRNKFVAYLARETAMRQPWFRALIHDVRFGRLASSP